MMISELKIRNWCRSASIALGVAAFGSLTLPAATRVTVEGTINEKPALFVFDTGTGFPIVVQARALNRLGLTDTPPQDPPKVKGQVALGLTAPADVKLLGLNISQARLGVIYPPVASDVDFDAIAGWPLMKQNVLSVRGGGSQVRIMADIPKEVTSWKKIPLISDSLVLKLEVDSAQAPLLVDTGAKVGYQMTSAAWSDWRRLHPTAKITLRRYYSPGQGHIVLEESVAARIKIGDIELSNVLVSGPSPMSQGQLTTAPVIGMAALARLNLVVDCRQNVAYVQPIAEHGPVGPYNRAGAVFIPLNDRDRALKAVVLPSMPAARAGLRTGDILVSVGDYDWTKGRPDGAPLLDEILAADSGTRIALTVQRGKKNIRITFVLKDILEAK